MLRGLTCDDTRSLRLSLKILRLQLASRHYDERNKWWAVLVGSWSWSWSWCNEKVRGGA